jgi:ubiquinol-cytochrome c reductase cytochrome c1 subunit
MPIKKAIILLVLAAPGSVWGATGGVPLMPAGNDVSNQASLQRGARNFVNYCLGCHSAKYVRYNRLAQDLGLSEEQVIENLMFTGERPFDTMQIAMKPADAQRWFGVQPPDLSLIARSRGTDYIYTFLHSFYADDSRPTGVNNLVLPGTAMPHVLWEKQGIQKALYEGETDEQGNMHKRFTGFELVRPGQLSPEQYDEFVRDTVNFLDYIGEPMKLERQRLGIRVIGFLLVFFLFAYLLKREYWKDVK